MFLKELKGIRQLGLLGTQATPEGVKDLQAALPGTHVTGF
jgi:hypothetical protein